jgi:DNA modification methylase
MHTSDYTQDDYDSLVSALNAYSNGINQDTYYEPTVSPKERNLGLNLTNKINKRPIGEAFGEGSIFSDSQNESNTHPTLKPIEINKHFLSLFRLPKEIIQTLYIPFSGAGSEIIGAIKAGYDIDNIIACEINPDYVEIAKHRIEYYNNLQPEVIEQKQLNNSITKNTLF